MKSMLKREPILWIPLLSSLYYLGHLIVALWRL